jgi:hypothetical protein
MLHVFIVLLRSVLKEAEKKICTSLTHNSAVSALLCNTFTVHLTNVVHT